MDLTQFHPTRRRLIRALVMGMGMSPAVLAVLKSASAASMSTTPIVQGFQKVVGDVRLNGVKARVGQSVHPGDICTTGTGGECVIVIGEHVFLLRSDSEVEFSAVDFEVAQDTSLLSRIKIAAGAVLSVFGDTSVPATITTPLATIGIRGTGLYVEVWPDKNYVCLCYGRAELRANLNPDVRETLDTFHHDAPRNFYAKPEDHNGLFIAPEKMLNHQDEELIMLEALVGRIPLFGPKPIKMPDAQ